MDWGHSLVAGEVFGNSSSGGCTGPDLHSLHDLISYGRVQPLPHTQADIHGHTDHTQTHTSDAQLVTPTTALPQPRGVSPALRLQGQGHPDCGFHPTVFPSGWWARANVSLARQHKEEGSLTPRRWGLPQEALPCLAEPQLTGRDSRTPESWSSAKREGQCLAPGEAALLGGGALVVR